MSDIEQFTGGALTHDLQEILDLDAQRVQNFWDVVEEFPDGFDDVSSPAVERVLKIGSYASILAGCSELYLRSVESMTYHQDLDSGNGHEMVTKAVDKTRTVLGRVMGIGNSEARSLTELFPHFRNEYLSMFPIRANNVFYGNGMERAINERDFEEAVAVAHFMGRAVVMPVVEVSSQLFEAVLRTRQDAREPSAINYFKGNLNSCKVRSPQEDF